MIRTCDGKRRTIFDALKAQGWLLNMTAGGHIRARSPSGATVFLPGTPSDHRNALNEIAILRRYGFIWKRAA